jgi:mono/diheme cytochrome c family protein
MEQIVTKSRICLWMIAVLSVVVLLIGSLPQKAATAESGKALYGQLCVSCHGQTGDGKGPMVVASKGAIKVPPFAKGKDSKAVLQVILKGKPGTMMQGYEGQLDANKRKALLQYVLSLTK